MDYLQFKETLSLALVNKQFYQQWLKWQCQEVLEIKDLKICKRYPNFKFSIRLRKLPDDIPENLRTLDLSYTQISDISCFNLITVVKSKIQPP